MTAPRPNAERRDFDLVVLGEINPDIVVSATDPTPVFGQVERFVDAVTLTIGSSSVIMACGAARLGLRVAVVGVVGDDALGRYMFDAMRDAGLVVDWVRTDAGVPTGATVILAGREDRAILTARGTIGAVRADDVPPSLLARTRHLHVGSWFLQDLARPGLPALFRAAHDAGVTTSVDPNWDPAETWDGGLKRALGEIDLLFPNDREACRIADRTDAIEAGAAIAATAAVGGRPGHWCVVKLGAAGGAVLSSGGIVARAGTPLVEPVDTIGAGDSFDAGFLRGWLDGRSSEESLRLAVACGSLSTRAVGGTSAQPTLAEAETVAGMLTTTT
ncbi:MAG: carbohydrate kinase family protein [Chloroflexota bacterium]